MTNFGRSSIGIIAASVMVGLLAGCGGAGSSNGEQPPNQTSNNNMNFTGGVPTISATTPNAVPATTVPQQINVTLPSSTTPQVVWIPAGVALTAGESFAVIPADTVIFQNLTGGSPGTRGGPLPGTVTINGASTGVLLVNGTLNGNLGIPAGNWTFDAYGPFTESNGVQELTVQQFEFKFESNGTTTSLPYSITGTIPANGSNNLGNVLTCTFNSVYASGIGQFTFTDSNGSATQKDPVAADGVCIIHDYVNTTGARQIPSAGVNLVQFIH